MKRACLDRKEMGPGLPAARVAHGRKDMRAWSRPMLTLQEDVGSCAWNAELAIGIQNRLHLNPQCEADPFRLECLVEKDSTSP